MDPPYAATKKYSPAAVILSALDIGLLNIATRSGSSLFFSEFLKVSIFPQSIMELMSCRTLSWHEEKEYDYLVRQEHRVISCCYRFDLLFPCTSHCIAGMSNHKYKEIGIFSDKGGDLAFHASFYCLCYNHCVSICFA